MTVTTRYHYRMAWPNRDEAVLGRLKVACWRESYPGLLPEALLDRLDAARDAREWRRSLADGIAWIAEQGGEPVGFGHMQGGEVTMLYLRAAHQRNGVGRELLERMFDEIGCLGHRKAHLWVLEENERARRFYRHMGGRLTARRSVGFPRWPHIMEVRYDFAIAN